MWPEPQMLTLDLLTLHKPKTMIKEQIDAAEIIEQSTDMAGRVRILWQSQETHNFYQYKFESAPSLEHLNELSDASDAQAALAAIIPLGVDFSESRDLILGFIEKVRSMPTMVLSQYTTYVNSFFWSEGVAIKNFVSVFSEKLNDRGLITVSTWTEGTVVREVRDFILQTSDAHLERLIFG